MEFGGVSLVSARLNALSRALSDLVATVDAGGLDALDDPELVGFSQGFEAVRNWMPLVDHRVLREAEERQLAGSLGQGRLSRC